MEVLVVNLNHLVHLHFFTVSWRIFAEFGIVLERLKIRHTRTRGDFILIEKAI